jgi:hypothetical protein
MSVPRPKAARRKERAPRPSPEAASPKADRAAAPNVAPAAFDADVNVNVHETKILQNDHRSKLGQSVVARRRSRRDLGRYAAL